MTQCRKQENLKVWMKIMKFTKLNNKIINPGNFIMKKLFAFLILTNTFFVSAGQEFEDLFETLPKNDRFNNLMNLSAYQKKYPSHAIAYFKLGEIFDDYMRELNPIFYFNLVNTNYNQLTTHYKLVKHELDDKQARQDRDMFGEIQLISGEKKAGIIDINNEVDKRLLDAKQYFLKAQNVHDNYYRCVNKYNECLFKYREILQKFEDYKKLYLLATSQIRNDIENIASNFDSALVFFDAYRESCVELPHLLTVNYYKLREITTYRLEGLTESDFTKPLVQLWDFKKWADNFIYNLDTDIKTIRNGLNENQASLTQQIQILKTNEVYSDTFNVFKTNPVFQNLIGKYDYNSISNKLLEYQNAKIDFLLKTRTQINNPADSMLINLMNILWFYKNLADQKTALNEMATWLKQSITIENTGKYIDFYMTMYNGLDGFIRWCDLEKYDNDQIFKKNLKNLTAFIEKNNARFNFSDSILWHKNKKMAFGKQNYNADSIYIDTLLTSNVVLFRNRWFYLYGIEYDKLGKNRNFISKISPEGKIDWLQFPNGTNFSAEKNRIFNVSVTEDSICWILNGLKNSDSASYNLNYSKYDWNGNLVEIAEVEKNAYPVYFWNDEINQQFCLITQHVNEGRNELTIGMFNYPNEKAWQKTINLDGNILDVINTNSDFLIVCNTHYLEMPEERFFYENHDNKMVITSIYITRQGSIKNISAFQNATDLNGTFAKKILNNAVNILGKSNNELFYLLIDNQGKPTFSTLTNLKTERKNFGIQP